MDKNRSEITEGAVVNVNRYTSSGRIDKTVGLRMDQANRAYQAVAWQAEVPFQPYVRVTLTDPLAGNRIVRDTDHEVWGRQTIAPGTIMYHGTSAFGNGGE